MSQSEDPFKHPDFLYNILLWIGKLDADQFRRAAQSRGFFTDLAQLQELQRIKKYEGNDAHNSQIINIIQPGGNLAYSLLCDAIHGMSPLYDNMYRKMILLLPEDQPGTTDVPANSIPSDVSIPTTSVNVDLPAASSRTTDGMMTLTTQGVNEEADTSGHVQRLVQHLNSMNEDLCNTTADHSDLIGLSSNVRQYFVPLQAITEKDAVRLMHRARQRTTRFTLGRQQPLGRKASTVTMGADEDESSDVEGGEPFDLSSVVQLLARPCHGPGAGVGSGDADILEKSCMVIGHAGQGKTALCKRILAEVMETTTGAMNKVKFIFYVPCRDVTLVQSPDWCVFLGLDHPQLRLSRPEQKTLLHYLTEHSDQVMILLDGIDEEGSDAFREDSAARAVVLRSSSRRTRSCLMDATVITTSRPCSAASEFIMHCRRRFLLKGFSEDQLKVFCHKHLGTKNGQQCMAKLLRTANASLKEAIRGTPLLCALLVQQYHIADSLPSSITRFYEQYLCSALAKLELRRGEKFGKVRLTRAVTSHLHGTRLFEPGDLVNISTVIYHQLEGDIEDNVDDEGCDHSAAQLVHALKALYQLCLQQLQRGSATFKAGSLTGHHLTVLQSLGLLVNAGRNPASIDSTSSVSLAHFTIQEWCATRAIVSSNNCVEDIKRCGIDTISLDTNTHMFWRFVFGSLKPEHLCPVLDAIKCSSKASNGKVSRKMLLFLMNCFLENCQSLEKADMLQYEPDLDTGDSTTCCYASAAHLLAVDGIGLEYIHLEIVDVMAICNVLDFLPQINKLEVYGSDLSHDGIHMLSSQLDKCVEVHIGGNKLTGVPLQHISNALSSSTRAILRILYLGDAEISGSADGAALARCVQHPSLMRLDASKSALGNDGLAAFVSNLEPCSHLTDLALAGCVLKSGCGSDLA
eukprot:scpid39614/ scgid3325/ 